ncbi:SpoIID/LytB domain-containing protein [bacterium]|nr:SpoIID/LytB domain-containing protein [bacterium]
MRNLGLVLVLICLSFSPVYGAFWTHDIPQTTLEIAKNFDSNLILPSKTVRVGIGTNNFSSYEWNEANIYATGEFEIYDGENYISTFDGSNEINVKIDGKTFVLTDSDGEVITKVQGPVIFKTDFGFVGVKDLKRAGKDALYRGQLELVTASKEGKFHIINSLELEDYLKGVVPNEMPVSFGLEALKAQAVAARNYVLSPRVKANPNYDVVDSVASQVYFGVNTERELSNRAVNETSGIVALYDWDLILAQYSSTAGGYTESYSNAFSDPITKKFPSDPKPYLIAKPDYDDFDSLNDEENASRFYKSKPKSFDVKSSYYRWEREWNGQEIQDAIQANIASQSLTGFVKPAVKKDEIIGIIKKIEVTKRGDSGKIIELEIQTDSGNYTVQKELVIRRLFTCNGKALPSANVVFEHEYNDDGDLIYLKAYGGGFGHGVGMSQYGAGYMATELHKSYDEILKHYYNGIKLGTEPAVISNWARTLTRTFYTKNGKACLVVDNKYNVKSVNITINGEEYIMEFDQTERYNIIDLSQYLTNGMNTVKLNFTEEKNGIKFYIEMGN